MLQDHSVYVEETDSSVYVKETDNSYHTTDWYSIACREQHSSTLLLAGFSRS